MAKKKKNTSKRNNKAKSVNETSSKKKSISLTEKNKVKVKKESNTSKKSTSQSKLVSKKTLKENIKQKKVDDRVLPSNDLLKKIVNAPIEEEIKKTPKKETFSTEESKEQIQRKREKKTKTWAEKAQKLPTFEVSNFPKLPVKDILITQSKPIGLHDPYQLLIDKYKVNIHFRPFIKVEGLTAQEFRNQRIDVLEFNGIIFTSRLAVDHFFRIMNEMRITLPDTVKFFCMSEQIAYYMQKYVEFRKRRIFWGQGTIDDLNVILKKNLDRKFLLPASDAIREKVVGILDNLSANYNVVDVYKTVPENISDIKLEKYDMIVFFTPIAIEALHKYFPKFKQNKIRFAAYSIFTANKIKELGYRVDIFAPTIEFPSMVNAIAHYLLHIE